MRDGNQRQVHNKNSAYFNFRCIKKDMMYDKTVVFLS